MKKIGQTFLGIIALMGVVLVFTQCSKKDAAASAAVAEGVSTELLPVAYVDADSLVAHLNFHKRLADDFETKLGKQNASLNASGQKLQNEIIAFQQKVQNNAFLSQERAQQEQTRIQRMQADLEKRADQVQQELAVERSNIQLQLNDSLTLGIKEFNTPQKYQMIVTKSSMLYADERYDITKEVTEFLNKRFK
ncbi:MAG: OmpH family outer membrane protein [Candidatus Symbiothrix sp.]|jgi:outer membrane protein|nr:OmpH family outer membrane protein [Candidatus Symbiothrix sp.]